MGYLRNGAGFYLQGWPAAEDGTIPYDPSDLNRLQAINVAQVGGAVEATTRAAVSANLRSSQTPSAAAAAYDPLNGMSAYDPLATPATGVKPDFEMQIPISDSKGGQRLVTIGFLRMAPGADPAATANGWHAEIYVDPSEVVGGPELAAGQIARGEVFFTPDGRLDTTRTTLFGTPFNSTLTFGASDAAAPTGRQVNWAPSLGVAAQSVALDLESATGGLTQYDSASALQAVSTNGTAFGDLTNIEIDEQGFVTAIYDNGVTRRIAQVALATFANPDGLKPISGNAYRVSTDSGPYSLKLPGTGGAGVISPATLESSTVDLSTEFTGLITTQRAYSASSKIITTADEMLDELIRMKR
jgi:flagellar hook protein FlgE